MDVNERYGNTVTFYFIPLQTNTRFDENYKVSDEKIKKLILDINQRGHKIGIHPGYDTYNDENTFTNSVNFFQSALADDVQIGRLESRQHYLRFDIQKTPLLMESNSVVCDSTLGFAERSGFRAGVCYEYSMYDLTNRRKLNLRQLPLIIMDVTLISYEGLGFNESAIQDRIRKFEGIVKRYEGALTILWHNSSITNFTLYDNVVK